MEWEWYEVDREGYSVIWQKVAWRSLGSLNLILMVMGLYGEVKQGYCFFYGGQDEEIGQKQVSNLEVFIIDRFGVGGGGGWQFELGSVMEMVRNSQIDRCGV